MEIIEYKSEILYKRTLERSVSIPYETVFNDTYTVFSNPPPLSI
jgi:hypothetical protein